MNDNRNAWLVEFFLDVGLRSGPALQRGRLAGLERWGKEGLTGFGVVRLLCCVCALQLLKLVVLTFPSEPPRGPSDLTTMIVKMILYHCRDSKPQDKVGYSSSRYIVECFRNICV